jgi:putative (di)nucleoside polyphosphate hydrolase
LSRFLTWPAHGNQAQERRHSARYLRQPHAARTAPAEPDAVPPEAPAEPALVVVGPLLLPENE